MSVIGNKMCALVYASRCDIT